METVSTIEGGWSTTREAERGFHEAGAGDGDGAPFLCTHFVPGMRTVVVSVHAGRHSLLEGGRAFAFPGGERLVGRLSVAEVLAKSAIDRVVMLGNAPVAPETVLETQRFVRPVVAGRALVLHVRPAAGGAVVPFEQPTQTPCCAEHG